MIETERWTVMITRKQSEVLEQVGAEMVKHEALLCWRKTTIGKAHAEEGRQGLEVELVSIHAAEKAALIEAFKAKPLRDKRRTWLRPLKVSWERHEQSSSALERSLGRVTPRGGIDVGLVSPRRGIDGEGGRKGSEYRVHGVASEADKVSQRSASFGLDVTQVGASTMENWIMEREGELRRALKVKREEDPSRSGILTSFLTDVRDADFHGTQHTSSVAQKLTVMTAKKLTVITTKIRHV
ncbi:hypothetical protein ACLOJK_031412 [Asimina triloba]